MQAAANSKKTVKIAQFDKAGHFTGIVEVDRIVKPDAEWRKLLPPEAYQVTRHKGTERAFMNSLHNNHRDGLYSCVCCGTMLFDSKTKFESGTGWPSFWAPIAQGERRRSAPTSAWAWSATRSPARAATAISATSSTTAPGPPASATA